MKIAIIIYAISWLILLLWYGKMFIWDKYSRPEWWFWIIIFVFAPIIILILPFAIFSNYKEKKIKKIQDAERQRQENERQRQEKLRQEKVDAALQAYDAVSGLNCCTSYDYISIARSLLRIVKGKRYDAISKCLDKISLPKEYELKIKECEQSGIGDKSKPYIKLPDGDQDFNIFKYLNVEQSCMGAWQAYLLYTLWHVLPLWWHANYDSRDYVFSEEDAMFHNMETITELAKFNKEELDENSVALEVAYKLRNVDATLKVINRDDKYYVSCCYWTMFGGLIREFVEITIQDNKVKEFVPFKKDLLIEFECGIKF